MDGFIHKLARALGFKYPFIRSKASRKEQPDKLPKSSAFKLLILTQFGCEFENFIEKEGRYSDKYHFPFR